VKKLFCDRCHKEVKTEKHFFRVRLIRLEVATPTHWDREFCEKCYQSGLNWLIEPLPELAQRVGDTRAPQE
jgi:RNase P subunit RPR2